MALPARQDWRVRVELAGVDVTARVVSDIEVTAEEDTAMLASLTLHDAGNDVAPSAYMYQPLVVEHDALDAAGALVTTTRVFEGIVQGAEVALDRRTVALRGSDQLQALVEAMTRAEVDTLTPGALWHAEVFADQDNQWTYLQQRLESLPASVHRVVGGAIAITPWDTAVAPLAIDDGDALAVDVDFADRRDRPDEIRLHVQMRYPRRWRRRITQAWNYPRTLIEYAQAATDLPSRAMVRQAANGVSGWAIADLSFNPVWADQTVRLPNGSDVFFTHDQINFVQAMTGEFERTWTQTVTDTITVSVHAWPAGLPPAAPIVVDQTASIDVDAAEDDEDAPAAPAQLHGAWPYEDDGRAGLGEAMTCAVRLAERELQSAWREGSVEVRLPCVPGLTLASRLDVATQPIRITGKVRQYTHRWTSTTTTTHARIAIMDGRHAVARLSSHAGGADPGAVAPPAVTSAFTVPGMTTQLADNTTVAPLDDTEPGFSGNYSGLLRAPAVPYTYRFRFDLPGIPAELRDAQESDRPAAVEVQIPAGNIRLWPP